MVSRRVVSVKFIYFMHKGLVMFRLVAVVLIFSFYNQDVYGSPDIDAKKVSLAEKRLQKWFENASSFEKNIMGYPVNQEPNLMEFYRWYIDKQLPEMSLNNVGKPMVGKSSYSLNSHEFEN